MHDHVKEYYGRHLQRTADLRTTACCDASQTPDWLKPLLARIHPEVTARYYGCGLVCPPLLAGCRVLDLGCGAGRDLYALAQLVGEGGQVVGVDMTEEQLAVAERHRDYQRQAFGFSRDNVELRLGYIERLDELGLAEASFDVVVSNCVVNLSPDKHQVFREAFRVLRPNGRLAISDIVECGRPGMAAVGLGILNAVLAEAVKFANERVLFGKPISKLQAIQWYIAEIYSDLEIAKLLAYRVGWMRDQGMSVDAAAPLAKHWICEAAARSART